MSQPGKLVPHQNIEVSMNHIIIAQKGRSSARLHLRALPIPSVNQKTRLGVKFSRRYSQDAHEFAHKFGFAPCLHAVLIAESMTTRMKRIWRLALASTYLVLRHRL